MTEYKVVKINNWGLVTAGMMDFFMRVGRDTSLLYDNLFDWRRFPIKEFIENEHLWVCLRDGKPVGVMLASDYLSTFDNRTKILYQELFYVTPGNSRAAKHLMHAFIDFGRNNANHIYTMTAPHANIKGRSLERLGFRKTEELYLLEV